MKIAPISSQHQQVRMHKGTKIGILTGGMAGSAIAAADILKSDVFQQLKANPKEMFKNASFIRGAAATLVILTVAGELLGAITGKVIDKIVDVHNKKKQEKLHAELAAELEAEEHNTITFNDTEAGETGE